MAEADLCSHKSPVYSNLPSCFQYSPSLNCIISLSKDSGIEILDIHSGQITSRSAICAEGKSYFFTLF